MQYVKYRYEVNVRECAEEIINRLNNIYNEQEKLEIKTYISVISTAADSFLDSVKPENIPLNEFELKQLNVLSVFHPSFVFWLAHFLAITKPNKIKLALDEYYFGTYGQINNFLGSLQYQVLDIMEKIPLSIQEQINELISWHREVKKESIIQKSSDKEIKNTRELKFLKKTSKKTDLIKFDNNLQHELLKIISNLLSNKKDKNTLIVALQGYLLEEGRKIKLQISVSVFVDMFARIKTENNLLILSNNKNISTWITHNFLFYNNNLLLHKSTSIQYCEGVFSNKNRPQKNKRLSIESLIKNCS